MKQTAKDSKKLRKNVALSALVVILTAGMISRLPYSEELRAVEIVSYLAFAISLAVLTINSVLYFRYKKKSTQ